MLSLQIPWLSFVQLVVPWLIISICFFIAYLGQRKCTKRLWKNQCMNGDDYDMRKAIEKHMAFTAGALLFISIIFLFFSLFMAGKLLKFF